MSFLCTRVHFIWSTARREPTIESTWKPNLHAYIHGILTNKKSKALAIGGIADHIHVYTSLPPTHSIAELANVMKSNSSSWVTRIIFHHSRGRKAMPPLP